MPSMYLILSKELIILAASDLYLKATNKRREAISDQYIFDVFPMNEGEPEHHSIGYSLQTVLATREVHTLPVTRFDTPDPENPDATVERHWLSSHTPVLNDAGGIDYIIHHTQDVTNWVTAEQKLTLSLEKERMVSAHSQQLQKRLEKLLLEVPARMAILSGPDLVYEFINQRYQRERFGGREMIGKPLAEVLPEIKSTPAYEAIRRVYQTGETFEGKELSISIVSAEGDESESYYFDLIYQARYDEKGQIDGVLSFAYDVTELVKARKVVEQKEKELKMLNSKLEEANLEILASNEEILASNEELQITNETLHLTQQRLIQLNAELEERVNIRTVELLRAQQESEHQRERLNRFFMQAPAGICVLDGKDLVFELINPPFQKLFPDRKMSGRPILEALPELKEQGIWDILQNVYETGRTFEGHERALFLAREEGGALEERYFNFIYQARLDQQNKVDGVLVFVFEVTEVVRNRRLEEQNEKRFRFLLDTMPQQVWTTSEDGSLNYVNQVVCNDFGKTAEEVIASGLESFIHPDDIAGFISRKQIALETGVEYMAEFRLLFGNGQYCWHLGRAVPLVENEKVKLWLGTNTNIEIQKSNEQKKDEFLSIASHELKTPLTSIKAFNQLMQRPVDPERLSGFIKKSSEHIFRLEKLINDLLDVTKINAGKMNYTMQEFNFKQMLLDSIESVQHTALRHRIILENAEDIVYTGDRFRLEQVLNNFLNNAIKYSPMGEKVIVNCVVQLNNIIVSVQDFGIGIAERDMHRLFERYYRVDNTAMRFEGLGLGLFIASEILKRHKGSFWIESMPDEGSTFYFRLPLSASAGTSPYSEQDKFYQDPTVSIRLNEEFGRLDVDWTGFQNLESVQHGCMRMLKMLSSSKVNKVLNDNSHVQGTWSEASDWVGQDWFPMMEKEGLRYFAWVYSPSSFSQLSAQKSVDVASGGVSIKLFTDIASAEQWINNK